MPNCKVIDIFHGTEKADFAAAKAGGVLGVIHKSSQGKGFVDDKYAQRRTTAAAQGLLWGAYHFGTSADVAAQVQHFLDTAKPDANTLLALDFETNEPNPSDTMSLAQAKQFVTMVQAKTGRLPVVYGGALIRASLGHTVDPVLAQCRLWWAQYASVPTLQATWLNYFLWQHTDGKTGPQPHEAPGIGPCDCNTFDGSALELAQQWAI
jgi:lysozyme